VNQDNIWEYGLVKMIQAVKEKTGQWIFSSRKGESIWLVKFMTSKLFFQKIVSIFF
jgi:hypothetical protein